MLLVFYLTRRKMNFLKENQVKIQSRMGDGWKWVAKFVARPLAKAALWVRIQTYQNTKWAT
jgi:hypothetical protein